MMLTQGAARYLEPLAIEWFGRGGLAGRLKHVGDGGQGDRIVPMIVAEPGAEDFQRLAGERFGLFGIALKAANDGQVFEAVGVIGMVLPQRLLANGDGLKRQT